METVQFGDQFQIARHRPHHVDPDQIDAEVVRLKQREAFGGRRRA
jgi:hypothetical protein